MHSSYRKWEAFTECGDTIASGWMFLSFRRNCAF
jgi:hypothetical protein